MIAEHNGEKDELAERVNDLLLPIVKGYGSERSWVLLGTESLQTFGGSGFLQEYPIEQYVRDAKIDTLYEGTTAIQGQDFFFRKIVKDQAKALGHLAGRDRGASSRARPATAGSRSSASCSPPRSRTATRSSAAMIGQLMSADVNAEGGDVRNIYKVGLNTTRLLMVLGDIVCSWLLLRQAEVALDKLGGEVSDEGPGLLRGQGRRGPVLRPQRPAQAHRRAPDRRDHRPLADGRARERVLSLAETQVMSGSGHSPQDVSCGEWLFPGGGH